MAISEPSRATRPAFRRGERNSSFRNDKNETKETQNEEEDEKPRTLFVGNVPREVHKREIEEVFGEIGPLKRCYIQYPRGENEKKKQQEDTTVAYVTFALSQDATNALETLQNSKIGNNRINIKFAKTRSEQTRQTFGSEGSGGRFQRNANFEPVGGVTPQKVKAPREKSIKKKSRLIIRNLSFKVTDENLKAYFQKFGDVKEVNILKKSNGKLVGCAFIQYQNVFQAANAIKELNSKPFLGRPIAIDWALPKEKYQTDEEKSRKKSDQATEETSMPGEDSIVIKDEPESEMEDTSSQADNYEHFKQEPMETDDVKEETKSEHQHKIKRKFKSDASDDDFTSEVEEKSRPFSAKRPKQLSNDVEEGKTLFLRNLSFNTTEDELKQFFSKFGQLHYALLCKDPLTEHPKGTGFVKFFTKPAADKCLQQYADDESEFKITDRQVNVSVALSKEKVLDNKPRSTDDDTNSKTNKNKPKSDSRNLYLVREGFVRPGSAAAADVSVTDMKKRASLNQTKKQMLKNLNIFVSPTRLCIHNLPQNFSDNKLKKLFAKYAGSTKHITEARIMRDMKNTDLNGKGMSKEFGFVNFKDHEIALDALRAINNNPDIFKPNSRPIVEFSLENRMAIKAKEKRALKSKEKNPNVQTKKQKTQKDSNEADADSDVANDDDAISDQREEKKKQKSVKRKKGNNKQNNEGNEDRGEKQVENDKNAPKYAGLVGKKGVQSVPSFKPKGKITRNSLKPKKSKKIKKIQERRQREPKIRSKRPVERFDKTEKIIAKHKQTLDSAGKKSDNGKKKKWFN